MRPKAAEGDEAQGLGINCTSIPSPEPMGLLEGTPISPPGTVPTTPKARDTDSDPNRAPNNTHDARITTQTAGAEAPINPVLIIIAAVILAAVIAAIYMIRRKR